MKTYFKLLSLFLSVIMLLSLAGCNTSPAEVPAEDGKTTEEGSIGENNIAILYTNDVHCAVDEGVGYSGVANLKKTLKALGKDVLLVDSGDFVQGEFIGSSSEGENIIEIMNKIPYDVTAVGNHSFGYGIDKLFELENLSDFPMLSCNFRNKDGELLLAPYVLRELGGVKIAFIGVTTPETISTSNPTIFQDENGEYIYSFVSEDGPSSFYENIQKYVDESRNEGAQIVILLTHLGNDEGDKPYTANDVIANTYGVNAVLDAHSHNVCEEEHVKNVNGDDVVYSQTGTRLQNVGLLTIAADNTVSTKLISAQEVNDIISEKVSASEEVLNQEIGTTDYDLVIYDPKSPETRIVRVQETNLADLCADAFKWAVGADCAFINGGGIRVNVAAGPITFGNTRTVYPFGNTACLVEVTGQQILDGLEFGVRALPSENGGFPQVSGISYSVDLSVESTVTTSESGEFVSIDGERRVFDVMINGEPIDPEKTYKVAGTTYILVDGGDGYTCFNGGNVLSDEGFVDADVFASYITEELGGVIPEEYSNPYGQGRITIVKSR